MTPLETEANPNIRVGPLRWGRPSAFPPVSRYPSMFFGASCYGFSHRAFLSFAELIEAGHGDVLHNRAEAALKCSKCGSKKLAVTLHGVGMSAPEA